MLFQASTFFHASTVITSIPAYSANSVSTFFRNTATRISAVPAFSASYLNQVSGKVDTFFPPAIGGSRLPTFSARFRQDETVTPEAPEVITVDSDLDSLFAQLSKQQVLSQDDGEDDTATVPVPDIKIVNNCGAPLSAFAVGNGQTQVIPAGQSSFVSFDSLDDSMQVSWALDRDSRRYGYAEVTLADGVHMPSFSLSFLEGNPFQFWGQSLEVGSCDTVECAPGDGKCPGTLHHLDKSGTDARVECPALRREPEITFTACTGLTQEGGLPEGMPSHPNFS